MTREEAIYRLNNTAWLGSDADRVATENAVQMAIEALKATQWIPCSERLPEYNESVLTWDGVCFSVEKRIPYICDDEDELIYSEWWVSDDYDEESDYYPNLRDGAAVAWMPLPEPYKENES